MASREKARKALGKIMIELKGECLSDIVSEMQNQLSRGYQDHVYLYSLHFLLEQGKFFIDQKIISRNVPILLSELFGELNEEKTND